MRFWNGNIAAGGMSLLTVVAPKFCCWSSAIAAMGAGASYLAWVHPMRPYLFGLSFIAVGYSFYKTYKSKKGDQTACTCDRKRNGFSGSKWFTWITAILVLVAFLINYI